MSNRLSRGFERLRDLVPDGAELESLEDVVRDDLPLDVDIDALLGAAFDYDPATGRQTFPRIRPILLALAARAAGANQVSGEAMYAAELLHLALSLHDLTVGQRGGKRRWLARRVVKRSVGWVAGNQLTLRAMELARHSRPEVLGEVLDTLRSFTEGQELLRELETGPAPTDEDWLEHADAHVGALFAFCCRSGGHVAGADPVVVDALGRYGRHLGRIWHIAEDISGMHHGDAGAHLVARALMARPVLWIIAACEDDRGIALEWTALVAHPEAHRADQLMERIRNTQGLARAREAMAKEAWAARKALKPLKDTPYRNALDRFASRLARSGKQ